MSEKVINLKLKELTPGMVIGKTIINSEDGFVIMKKGDVLDIKKIESIKNYFRENRKCKPAAIDANENIFNIDGEEKYLPPKTSRYIKNVMSAENQQMAISAAVTVLLIS